MFYVLHNIFNVLFQWIVLLVYWIFLPFFNLILLRVISHCISCDISRRSSSIHLVGLNSMQAATELKLGRVSSSHQLFKGDKLSAVEFTVWVSQISLKKNTPNSNAGQYLLFIGSNYPMKYFEGRVWLAKLLLLPLFSICFQFQREKHKLVCWVWVITSLLLLTHLGVWGKSFYLLSQWLWPQDSEERRNYGKLCNVFVDEKCRYWDQCYYFAAW